MGGEGIDTGSIAVVFANWFCAPRMSGSPLIRAQPESISESNQTNDWGEGEPESLSGQIIPNYVATTSPSSNLANCRNGFGKGK